jgi:peptidoglycan hydrolase CwlO-like protein
MQKELLKAKSDLYEVNYKNKKLKEKLFESKKEIERLKGDVYHY